MIKEKESILDIDLKLSVKGVRKLIAKYLAKTQFTFPNVRKVYPQLLTHEIVSVQPMSLPVGLTFWLDYSYGTKTSGSQE